MLRLALGALAGVLSAVLFIGPAIGGSVLIAIPPAYLTPLPILFSSFALGTLAGIAACVTGILGVAIAQVGFAGTLLYVSIHVMPVVMIHLRVLPSNSAPRPEVPGQVVTDLTVLGAATMMGVMAILGSELTLLTEKLGVLLGDLLEVGVPEVPVASREAVVAELVRYFPGFVTVWWVLQLVICAVLAQVLALRLNWARFHTPPYREFEVPKWMVGLFVLSLFPASLLTGKPAAFAGSFALVFGIPLLLQGLAVIHTVSQSWPGRRLLLFACYASLVWPFPLLAWALVTALGALDHVGGFRRLQAT